jgi:PAS domain S-box-containing protein
MMEQITILLVDDDPVALETAGFIFRAYEPSYRIINCLNAQEALEKIGTTEVDVLITDWEMPNMTGLELISLLRSQKKLAYIPAIITTGVKTSPSDMLTALGAGANDFIHKPYEAVELVARTRAAVTLMGTMRKLEQSNAVISENNTFIRSLIDGLPHPLVFYSIEGIIMGCNHSFESLVGLRNEQLLGTIVYNYLDATHLQEQIECDSTIIESCGEANYEMPIGKSNTPFLMSKKVYKNAIGNIEGMLCIMTDLSAVKLAHAEIIEGKKRELVSNALRLIQTSENYNHIVEELSQLRTLKGAEAEQLIDEMIKSYSVQQSTSAWDEFEMRFNGVYEGFYKSLSVRHPNLTPGEQKVCALLRLNLSSKEIAALTMQNSQSVDVARYRIRKKLQLSKEENLIAYLQAIN